MRRHAAWLLHCVEAAVTLLGAKAGWIRADLASPARTGAEPVVTRSPGRRGNAPAEAGSQDRAADQRVESGVERVVVHWAAVTDFVARRLFREDACLARATALQRVLARRQVATELRIGVRKCADGSIESHAWLEHGGEVVIGRLPDLDSYDVLA